MKTEVKSMLNFKKIISLSALVPLVCSCSYARQSKEFYGFDTMIQVTFGGETDISKDLEDLVFHLSGLCDAYTECGQNNVFTINLFPGYEVPVHKDLYELLKICQLYKEKTNNLFNPFSKLINDEWKNALASESLPDLAKIKYLTNQSLSTYFVFNDEKSTVEVRGDGKIDVGAIAKGFLLSKAKKVFVDKKIKDFIFDAGSSSVLLGQADAFKEDGLYNVGIYRNSTYMPKNYMKLKNTAVGTSSIFEQRYLKKDGKTFSHIINGRTGSAEVIHDMVVVIDEDPILCDVYSTIGMSLKIDEIKALENQSTAKFVVFKNEQIEYKHPGIEVYTR